MPECGAWCDPRYADVHCEHEACEGCLFCEVAKASHQPCDPADGEDSEITECKTFCTRAYANSHCLR